MIWSYHRLIWRIIIWFWWRWLSKFNRLIVLLWWILWRRRRSISICRWKKINELKYSFISIDWVNVRILWGNYIRIINLHTSFHLLNWYCFLLIFWIISPNLNFSSKIKLPSWSLKAISLHLLKKWRWRPVVSKTIAF